MKARLKWNKLLSFCLALAFLLALAPGMAMAAGGTCGKDLQWTLDSEGVLTISGTGAMTDYSRNTPAPWTDLSDQVRKLVLESGVTTIGNRAFLSCSNLASAEIPAGVTSIGEFAFYGCSSLTEIALPAELTSIGFNAFAECTGLQSIEMPEEMTSIDSEAFYGCSSLEYIAIPKGVDCINDGTFEECTSLKGVAIPKGVVEIGAGAFAGCENLTDISIPAGVTMIGDKAFQYCSSLRNISLPTGVTEIGNWAFEGCSKLVSVEIPVGVKELSFGIFHGCSRLTSIIVPYGVTRIMGKAFFSCGLIGVYLPSTLNAIDDQAFRYCDDLADIYFGGLKNKWSVITKDWGNEPLNRARLYMSDEWPVPQTPFLFGAEAKPGGITLTWETVASADEYRVLRKDGSSTWIAVAEVMGSVYEDTEVIEGVVYTYTVQAVNHRGWSSYDKKGVSAKAVVSCPVLLDAAAGDEGITVTWERFPGARKYRVYRQDDSGEWQPLGDVTELSFTDGTVIPGTEYTYTVSALVGALWTDHDARGLSATAEAIRPVLTEIKADDRGVTVSWTAVPGAEKYKVLRKNSGSDWAELMETADTSCLDSSVSEGVIYAYTVQAYLDGEWGPFDGNGLQIQAEEVQAEPLAIVSVVPDKTNADAGDVITWTAAAAGGRGTLQYCFYVYKDGKNVYKGSYGSAKTVSYTAAAAGAYTAKVFVKDASGSVSLMSGQTTVTAPTPLTVSSIKADKASANIGDTITWTGAATGGSGTLQYCFYVYKDGKTVQKGSYGSAKSFSYKATAAGAYTAKVFVKDASGASVSLMSAETAVSGALAVSSIKANVTSANVGDTITWTGAATGGSGTLQYCFYVYKNGSIVQKGSYGSAKTFSYKATAAGAYTAKVFVKDASGAGVSLMSAETAVSGAGGALAVSSIKANVTSANVGDTITWTGAATGGSGTLQYCFYVYKDGKTVQKGSYGSAKTFSYKATAAGNYTAKVFVKDASGAGVSLLSAQTTVGGAPLAVSSIQADKTSANAGDTITWTASATGGSGTLQYCFYVYKDGKTVQKGSYGSAKTFSYKATAAGNYTAKVFVKDASGASVSLLSGQIAVS